jgi:hypothetical protein
MIKVGVMLPLSYQVHMGMSWGVVDRRVACDADRKWIVGVREYRSPRGTITSYRGGSVLVAPGMVLIARENDHKHAKRHS